MTEDAVRDVLHRIYPAWARDATVVLPVSLRRGRAEVRDHRAH